MVFEKTGSGGGLGGAAACPCAFPNFPGLNHVHCLLAGEEAGSGWIIEIVALQSQWSEI